MKVFKSNKPRVQFNWFLLNESVGTFEHSVISFPNSRNSYWNVLSTCKVESNACLYVKLKSKNIFINTIYRQPSGIKKILKIILVSFTKKQKPR